MFYFSLGESYAKPNFLAPRWGSLICVNPSPDSCQNNTKNPVVVEPNSQEIMSVFLTHLRYLLLHKQLVSSL